jgi:hypothetical protein
MFGHWQAHQEESAGRLASRTLWHCRGQWSNSIAEFLTMPPEGVEDITHCNVVFLTEVDFVDSVPTSMLMDRDLGSNSTLLERHVPECK